MRKSLCIHAASALALAAILGGSIAATGYAQTPPATPGSSAPATAVPPAGSAGGAAASGSTAPATGKTQPSHGTTASHHPGANMEQLAERRIADLHAKLHITAEQQQPWEQFAGVMRDNARQLDQAFMQRAEQYPSMNAVANMQSWAQIEQLRADGMQKLVPAFQALYNGMSDRQKKEADTLFQNRAEARSSRHSKSHPASSAH